MFDSIWYFIGYEEAQVVAHPRQKHLKHNLMKQIRESHLKLKPANPKSILKKKTKVLKWRPIRNRV